MGGQAAGTKEELPEGITQEQIDKLIAEKRRLKATRCEVVQEGDKQFLITEFPPL